MLRAPRSKPLGTSEASRRGARSIGSFAFGRWGWYSEEFDMRFALLSFCCLLALSGFVPQVNGGNDDKDAATFQGAWDLKSFESDGMKYDAVAMIQLVVATEKCEYRIAGKAHWEATWKLNSSKQPNAVDLAYISGGDKEKTVLGIYKLAGDSLTLCWGGPGKPRPTAFDSKQGVVFTYTRAKK
jgi:uncharacterized protein (TIGR03067 family)